MNYSSGSSQVLDNQGLAPPEPQVPGKEYHNVDTPVNAPTVPLADTPVRRPEGGEPPIRVVVDDDRTPQADGNTEINQKAALAAFKAVHARIGLPLNGQIPESLQYSFGEREVALDHVGGVWRQIGNLSPIGTRINPIEVTEFEVHTAYTRWFDSHQVFIPLLAVTAHCLDRACAAHADGSPDAQGWANVAGNVRAACGALCLYGVDFQPCPTIYCGFIRPSMPEGFTGLEIREREFVLLPAMKRFNDVFAIGTGPREAWLRGEASYHEHHIACMNAAVPSHKSLGAEYREKYGTKKIIAEKDFSDYDRWFSIERDERMTRAQYVMRVLAVIKRVTADIASGHRLQSNVVGDISRGMKGVLRVFGDWIGPVSPLSSHYPKSRLGE